MNGRYSRAWLTAFVAIVFVSGAGTGVLVDRYFNRPARTNMENAGLRGLRRGLSGERSERLIDRLSRDLSLTAEQHDQLDDILAQRREHLSEVNTEVRKRFETEQTSLRDEIRKILDASQQAKFDELMKRGPQWGTTPRGVSGGSGRSERGLSERTKPDPDK